MKTCNVCGATKPYSEFYPAKDCVGGVAGTCKVCRTAKNEEWRKANMDRRNKAAVNRRLRALRMYSPTPEPSCACCGEGTLAFLTFEHIGGGGRAHRKSTGGGGFISWLLAEHQERIEVLCMNCNHGRRVNDGVCPHRELIDDLLRPDAVPTWS